MQKIIGIVVEYNPFHNGHLYQIKKIKEKYKDSIIIVCTSSSFTQRADISILNKFDKTHLSLLNGVDVVVELPYVFSTQSSDIFAKASIGILNYLFIDTLCFGSESENIDDIIKCAKTQIYDKRFDEVVLKYLSSGVSYPTALNKALIELCNTKIDKPNDLLALSYIKEIYKNNYNIDLFNIKRTNSYHDKTLDSSVVSASNIRDKIINKIEYKHTMPLNVYNILKDKNISNRYFDYLKYKILSEDDLNKYVDVDEGLSTLIKKAINKSNDLDTLIKNIKTKRYTYNKISRMLGHILCSFTKDENNSIKDIEYIRILGLSQNGMKYINKIKKDIKVPILNKYDTKKYKTLNIEKRVSYIYSYIYEDIMEKEFSNKPIIIKKEE